MFATQLEAGRTPWVISGIVARVSFASAGTVTVRSAVSPRSSDGWTSWRSWEMNGRLASIIGPVEMTPGVSVRASARSGGKALFSALNAGIAVASVTGRFGDRLLEGGALAGERAGGGVEVRDQVLEVLRVHVDRRGDVAALVDPVRQVVGLEAERVVGDDRRVLVGGLPVVDRLVVRRRRWC